MPPGGGFVFGPYQLDTRSRQLLRNGEPVGVSPRQFAILHELVSHAGQIVPKERIVTVGWGEQAISDSSIEKAVSLLRAQLGPHDPPGFIVTFPRRGYRFAAPVTPVVPDADIEATLASYREWIEGRAALEAFERDRIQPAKDTFEQLIRREPNRAIYHAGLAHACAMEFESTRADAEPHLDALRRAETHARLACTLAPDLAGAWAALGFVLERTGERLTAVAALRRAVELEPDNCLHLLRLAYGTWGEERLRAARQALKVSPGLAVAHWLAASVFIARNALDVAERDVDAGITMTPGEGPTQTFTAPLFWLKGLLCLARGRTAEGLAALDHELSLECRGQLYSREWCAQVWYAKGATFYLSGNDDGARAAFGETLRRSPRHAMAQGAMMLLDRRGSRKANDASAESRPRVSLDSSSGFDHALAQIAVVADQDVPAAAALVGRMLDLAPPGNTGWLIPVDPLLKVQQHPSAWAATLAKLSSRAGMWLPA